MYEFSIPTFGKGVVYDIDHKIRAEHFRFFGEALKTSKLKEYVPHFVKETEVGMELSRPQQSCCVHCWGLLWSKSCHSVHYHRSTDVVHARQLLLAFIALSYVVFLQQHLTALRAPELACDGIDLVHWWSL